MKTLDHQTCYDIVSKIAETIGVTLPGIDQEVDEHFVRFIKHTICGSVGRAFRNSNEYIRLASIINGMPKS